MAPTSIISTPTSIVDQAWLFTNEEVKNPPSVQAGMSRQEELHTRAKAVRRLFQYKEAMPVPQIVVSSASVFIHRFYMRRNMQTYPWVWVSAAAFFLASKNEENSRRANEIIGATLFLEKNQTPRINDATRRVAYNDKDFDHQDGLNKLKKMEEAIMNAGCFDFTIRQPYAELLKGCKIVWRDEGNPTKTEKKESKATRIARCGWLFINDSLTTPLCLLCRPKVIAATALILSCIQLEETLPSTPTEIASALNNDEGAEEGEEPEKAEYWLDLFDVSPEEISGALKVLQKGGYNRAQDDYIVRECARTFKEADEALNNFPIPESRIVVPPLLPPPPPPTPDQKPTSSTPIREEMNMEESPVVEEKETAGAATERENEMTGSEKREEPQAKAEVATPKLEGTATESVEPVRVEEMGSVVEPEPLPEKEDVTMQVEDEAKKEDSVIPPTPPQFDDNSPPPSSFFAKNRTPDPIPVDITMSESEPVAATIKPEPGPIKISGTVMAEASLPVRKEEESGDKMDVGES